MQKRILFSAALGAALVLLVLLVFRLGQIAAVNPRSLNPLPDQDLLSKAKSKGSISVIVGLRVDFRPEGTLANPQAVQAQRDAISRAQDTLLRAMASMNVKSVQKFPYIPYMTMEVDEAGLIFLSNFPDVTSVKENVPENLTPIEGVH